MTTFESEIGSKVKNIDQEIDQEKKNKDQSFFKEFKTSGKKSVDKKESTKYLEGQLYNDRQIRAFLADLVGELTKEIYESTKGKLKDVEKDILAENAGVADDSEKFDETLEEAKVKLEDKKKDLLEDADYQILRISENLDAIVNLIMARETSEGKDKLSLNELGYLKALDKGWLRKLLLYLPEDNGMAEMMVRVAEREPLNRSDYALITGWIKPSDKPSDPKEEEKIIAAAWGASLLLENMSPEEKMEYARYLLEKIKEDQKGDYAAAAAKIKDINSRNGKVNEYNQKLADLEKDIVARTGELQEFYGMTYGPQIMNQYLEIQNLKAEMDDAPADSPKKSNLPQRIKEKENQLSRLVYQAFQENNLKNLEKKLDTLNNDQEELEKIVKEAEQGGIFSAGTEEDLKKEIEKSKKQREKEKKKVEREEAELADYALRYGESSKEYQAEKKKREKELNTYRRNVQELDKKINAGQNQADYLKNEYLPEKKTQLADINKQLSDTAEEFNLGKSKNPDDVYISFLFKAEAIAMDKEELRKTIKDRDLALKSGEDLRKYHQEFMEKNADYKNAYEKIRALDSVMGFLNQAQREQLKKEAEEGKVDLSLPMISAGPAGETYVIDSDIENGRYIGKQAKIDADVAGAAHQLRTGDYTNPLLKMNLSKTALYGLGIFSAFATIVLNVASSWSHKGDIFKNRMFWGAVGAGAFMAEDISGGGLSGGIGSGISKGVVANFATPHSSKKAEKEKEKSAVENNFGKIYSQFPGIGDHLIKNFDTIMKKVKARNPKLDKKETKLTAGEDFPDSIIGYLNLDKDRVEYLMTLMFNTLVFDLKYKENDLNLEEFIKEMKEDQKIE